MLQVLTITAYTFSVISFLLFVCLIYLWVTRKYPQGGLEDAHLQAGPDGIAKVLDSLAKLTDSFAKGGPLVMALVSAIFFFLVAMVGTGLGAVTQRSPTPPTEPPVTPTSTVIQIGNDSDKVEQKCECPKAAEKSGPTRQTPQKRRRDHVGVICASRAE